MSQISKKRKFVADGLFYAERLFAGKRPVFLPRVVAWAATLQLARSQRADVSVEVGDRETDGGSVEPKVRPSLLDELNHLLRSTK